MPVLSDLIEAPEHILLSTPEYLIYIENLMRYRQFTEDFLIKTVHYYRSKCCLKTQKSLTPYFCFRYLYDNDPDYKDDWTCYNDIIDYFQENQPDITISEIESSWQRAIRDRGIEF